MRGSLTGFGTDECFGDPPEAECHQARRGDPEDHRAAGLAGEGGQSAGLVRVAAGAERDPQNDVRDEKMQHPADGEACAGGVLERVVVGRPLGDALQRFVDHERRIPAF